MKIFLLRSEVLWRAARRVAVGVESKAKDATGFLTPARHVARLFMPNIFAYLGQLTARTAEN